MDDGRTKRQSIEDDYVKKEKITCGECLKRGEARLREAGIAEAANDAWLLFSEAFQMSRAAYYMDRNSLCDSLKQKQYEDWIAKRVERIPLQHIIGWAPFMGYEFLVNEQVLTPRADTEVLAEQAFCVMQQKKEELQSPLCVLDMCTGSGCIAVSLACLAREKKIACEITAVDLSPEALAVARRNNQVLCDGRVHLIQSNLFESLPDTKGFDIIVSNPPYIRSEEIEKLMPEVRDHEPRMALDGMEDGLYFYRELAKKSRHFLKPGGRILFEIGYDQGEAVSDILADFQYTEIAVMKDLAGLDRVITASLGELCE